MSFFAEQIAQKINEAMFDCKECMFRRRCDCGTVRIDPIRTSASLGLSRKSNSYLMRYISSQLNILNTAEKCDDTACSRLPLPHKPQASALCNQSTTAPAAPHSAILISSQLKTRYPLHMICRCSCEQYLNKPHPFQKSAWLRCGFTATGRSALPKDRYSRVRDSEMVWLSHLAVFWFSS